MFNLPTSYYLPCTENVTFCYKFASTNVKKSQIGWRNTSRCVECVGCTMHPGVLRGRVIALLFLKKVTCSQPYGTRLVGQKANPRTAATFTVQG